jgi:hypothetical protein
MTGQPWQPPPVKGDKPQGRVRRGFVIGLVAAGWLLLAWSTTLTLLASIQGAFLGIGALVTAGVVALDGRTRDN